MQERLSLRDRLDALSRRELVALAAVAAVVVAGAGLWYARSLPRPVEVRAARGAGPVAPPAHSPTESPSPTMLFVHVAGLVRHPGVYRFHEGQRVIDAVQAAGGPRRKADLDALNLAALLTDAEQILVPAQGAVPAAPVPAAGSSPGIPGAPAALVNVNTASEQELEALPGIGPVLANSIIAYRTEHGPFPTVDALDDVSGIGPATLADLRPLVTV
ncbi:MAG: helix-hairpin-helix domain-containing protein [Actinomycetota bacterium]